MFQTRQSLSLLLFQSLFLTLSTIRSRVVGFVIVPSTPVFRRHPYQARFLSAKETEDAAKSASEDTGDAELLNPQKVFPEAVIEEFSLANHRPLGCTVEESLADTNYVFVTKIVEGGNADKAGMQVGDVLVGITGQFGDMTSCIGIGVEKV